MIVENVVTLAQAEEIFKRCTMWYTDTGDCPRGPFIELDDIGKALLERDKPKPPTLEEIRDDLAEVLVDKWTNSTTWQAVYDAKAKLDRLIEQQKSGNNAE